MKLNIRKGEYNKATTNNGINYEIDDSKHYTYYEVELYERYCDIESKEELKECIKADLSKVIEKLEEREEERE